MNVYKYINKIRLDGTELCSICGTRDPNDHWRFINNNRVCRQCYSKEYRTRPGMKEYLARLAKVYRRNPKNRARSNAYKMYRLRNFGCNPLNDYFEGSHFHHLHIGNDHNTGLYIPAKLHMSVNHSSKTGTGMDEINALAISWFWEELKYDNISSKNKME